MVTSWRFSGTRQQKCGLVSTAIARTHMRTMSH
ncbi:hypothetical protein LTSEMIN_4183, partial [Salmonella enterica subsp. enterica serovar Minnesota str. A4-603]